jgi:predicted HicB family RNase H-like nuclease
MELMKYKGYYGSVSPSLEDEILIGSIECIRDLVTYEGETLPEIKSEFESAVDRYLETCQKLGKEPDKTYSGTFNVRIGSERHKQLHLVQLKEGHKSLNDVVCKAIDQFTDDVKNITNHHHYHIEVEEKIEKWAEPAKAIGAQAANNGRLLRVVK